MSDPNLIEAVKQAICDDLDRQMQSGPEHLYLAVDLHALAIAAVKAMTDFAPPPESKRPDGFECLMRLYGSLGETFWTHVMWQAPNDDEPEGVWMHWPDWVEVMHDPIAFAPLPAERTDR